MKTDFSITTSAHLGSMNTFGIDALADVLIAYDTAEALPQIAQLLDTTYAGMPLLQIGAGSNLLPASDFHGVVLKSRIQSIKIDGEHVTAGASVVFDDLVMACMESGLYGLENLSLIPGEVGAAAVQNIGAYGAEVKDFIERVEGYDLKSKRFVTFEQSECRYAYRDSIFKHEMRGRIAITRVTFRLSHDFVPNLSYNALARAMEGKTVTPQSIRDTIIATRNSKLPDPKVLGNAGSFFMNPIIKKDEYERLLQSYPAMPSFAIDEAHLKVPAAWLIEQCGWKGKSLGRAAVHDRQALVLVNLGGATGKEIIELKDRIVDDVQKRFGITMHPEVNIITAR